MATKVCWKSWWIVSQKIKIKIRIAERKKTKKWQYFTKQQQNFTFTFPVPTASLLMCTYTSLHTSPIRRAALNHTVCTPLERIRDASHQWVNITGPWYRLLSWASWASWTVLVVLVIFLAVSIAAVSSQLCFESLVFCPLWLKIWEWVWEGVGVDPWMVREGGGVHQNDWHMRGGIDVPVLWTFAWKNGASPSGWSRETC